MANGHRAGDVESTQLADNGQLAPWQVAPSNLRTARFIASAFAVGSTLSKWRNSAPVASSAT